MKADSKLAKKIESGEFIITAECAPGVTATGDTTAAALKFFDGKLAAVPAQFRVLARWWRADNSIRWVLVDLADNLGGFQAKTLRGFLIKNGRVGKMLRAFTITGKALEILMTTDAVGKEVSLDGGMCGKGLEDWVPVSGGGPYCRSQVILGGG